MSPTRLPACIDRFCNAKIYPSREQAAEMPAGAGAAGFDLTPPAMFRHLAALLHAAHLSGTLDHLSDALLRMKPFYTFGADDPASAAAVEEDRLSPSPLMPLEGEGDSGRDPMLTAALRGVGLPPMLAELVFDEAVVPLLPLGWGLPLLLKFGKLYSVR